MYENIYDHLMINDAHIPFSLPEWIAVAPFEEYLGMHIEYAGNGQAVLTMPFKAALCQGGGLMHGGAVVSLADTALAIAIKTTLPEGSLFATIEMGLTFHAPVRWGTVWAQARVLETKDRDIVGEVEVVTEEGIKAATFKATFRVKREKGK